MRVKTGVLLLSVLLLTATATSNAARADGLEGRAEFDGKSYYGKTLDTAGAAAFTAEADLSESDLKTPIAEWIVTPSERGSGAFEEAADDPSLYTPDFEQLTITFTQKSDRDNKLIVVLKPRGADNNYSTAINAAGSGQTPYGEFFNEAADKPIRLSTNYGGLIPYTFDGCAREKPPRFMDADGKSVELGAHAPVRLYYDSAVNALYTDTGFEGGRSRVGEKGSYRWRIRDFDKDDYISEKSSQTGFDGVWSGFTDGKTEVTFSFGRVRAGKSPSVLLLSLGGKPYHKALYPSAPSLGVAECPYPVPEPIYYDAAAGAEKSFAQNGGKFSVLDPAGKILTPEAAYRPDASFTPGEPGDYRVVYTLGTQSETLTVTVTEAGTPGTEIVPVTAGGVYYTGDTVDIGAATYNGLQTDPPAATRAVYREGELLDKADASASEPYRFRSYGGYEIVYESVDYVGRKTTQTTAFEVKRYYVEPKEGLAYATVYEPGETVPVEPGDFTIYDIPYAEYVAPHACEVTVSYEGGDFAPLNEMTFVREGAYELKYAMRYFAGTEVTAEAARRIYIYRENPEGIRTNGLPLNTRAVGDESGALRLKSVVGAEIRFPYGYFQSSAPCAVVFSDGTETADLTEAFAGGAYVFRPERPGVYAFTATAFDGVYKSVRAVFVDVRVKWYEANASDRTISLGGTGTGLMPAVVDYFGNPAEGGTVSVTYGGEPKGGEGFVADRPGEYTVNWSFSAESETISGSYSIRAVDDAPPALELGNGEKKTREGKFVRLAGCSVSDNSGIAPAVRTSVTKDGREVAVYDDGFRASETGTYTVTYTASDAAGNTVTASYTVRVKGWGGIIAICASAGGALLVAAGVVCLFVLKKRKEDKKKC